MMKIEAITLEEAYQDAASALKCSITELKIEVVQVPSKGIFGFFKKSAIIVAVAEAQSTQKEETKESVKVEKEEKSKAIKPEKTNLDSSKKEEESTHKIINDTIMPASFVSDQDDEDDDLGSGLDYTADYDDEFDEENEEEENSDSTAKMESIALEVKEGINSLFKLTCFSIEEIDVKPYDSETLLIEFKGDDAALLIGKEGYRYKALSYMIFNWINSKYDVQLRLEIAEFLKNQEESIGRYLSNVYENVERDGRAQTKILDGVLVQIALKELRNRYPDKYVVIRSTKDGLKYIIINDYHNN
ncbi:MAG: Jag N-terminal domain-containing protein [Campylobacterota bacterium]|nr:Jag N-terminal domain-containing protein [Campylobacterota bacterium]